MTSIEECVAMARLAEQAERYKEMMEYMKTVATTPKPGDSSVVLTVDERNLLSVAYKNAVGSRRTSWRTLSNLEKKEMGRGGDERANKIKEFRKVVETELKTICYDIIDIIEKTLLAGCNELEDRVFYLKMAADYYRYLGEFVTGAESDTIITKAKESYEKAMKEAVEGFNGSGRLLTTSPIYLGLALNYSVFYYEIVNDAEKACSLAKKVFDEAVADLDSLSEDDYKDATLILQLLRDNLTLWTSTDDEME